MEPPGAKEPRSTTVWLLACLWMSLILTCTGVGVALCAGFWRTFEQSLTAGMEQALEPFGTVFDFLGNLEVGNIETAYALTTEEFQSRHNLDEFAEFVAKHLQLKSELGDLGDLTEEELTADSCVFKITAATGGGRQSTFKLRLRKEKGKWKVDELVLP